MRQSKTAQALGRINRIVERFLIEPVMAKIVADLHHHGLNPVHFALDQIKHPFSERVFELYRTDGMIGLQRIGITDDDFEENTRSSFAYLLQLKAA